jgi:hypothetical protein
VQISSCLPLFRNAKFVESRRGIALHIYFELGAAGPKP